MFLVLSGEGPTDIGACNNQQGICAGAAFAAGPMTILVKQVVDLTIGYELDDIPDSYVYVSEAELVALSKARRQERRFALAGKKHQQETGFYYINSWMLGEAAQAIEVDRNDTAIAILFRDADGTRSVASSDWTRKWQSMRDGFRRADYPRGVPMLPKPKSEAWLLSHADNSIVDCAVLEDISGNDASPHSAKEKLADALGGAKSAGELCDWLIETTFDLQRAGQMPSWAAFRAELDGALALAMQ